MNWRCFPLYTHNQESKNLKRLHLSLLHIRFNVMTNNQSTFIMSQLCFKNEIDKFFLRYMYMTKVDLNDKIIIVHMHHK